MDETTTTSNVLDASFVEVPDTTSAESLRSVTEGTSLSVSRGGLEAHFAHNKFDIELNIFCRGLYFGIQPFYHTILS